MKNKGWALIFNIFLISLLLLLGVSLASLIFSQTSALSFERDYLKAYYLAEAGVEYAKDKLSENPLWCTPGIRIEAGNGAFEIRREPGSSIIYGIGYLNRARAIIKLDVIDNHTYLQREE